MHLLPVATSNDPGHVTACPFVLPQTPTPSPPSLPSASRKQPETAEELGS